MNRNLQPTAVALGLFDGVHLGHRAVLAAAKRQEKNGLVPCVFTFDAESAVRKGTGGYLYPTAVREHILHTGCGFAQVLSVSFGELRGMSGEDFAVQILRGRLSAAFVCCGRDFRFGRDAACGAGELAAFGQKYGFATEIVADVQAHGVTVSSRGIRSLLTAGEPERAAALLGSPYRIVQEVTHGAQLGRTIGFPTINQLFRDGQLVPRYGVYASRVTLPDGQVFPALTNIGIKPTVDYHGMPLAESYLDGFRGDLYGKTVQTELLRFLRPEQRFASVEALTAQMEQDLAASRLD